MIKAILFDIDGVLIDSFEANLKFISDLMVYFGHNPPNREEFPSLFHRPMKDIIRTLSKSTDEKEIEKIWMAGKDQEVPYPNELVSQPKYVKEVLESLSKDYNLGVVTSRTKSSIYKLPQLAELENHFNITVGYQDTDNHKPYPDPLLFAAENLGILPEECVYIGDAENDVVAAKAAGMKSIIFHPERLGNADANFSSFKELEAIIKSI